MNTYAQVAPSGAYAYRVQPFESSTTFWPSISVPKYDDGAAAIDIFGPPLIHGPVKGYT
ncbi:hypothetical protein ACX80D_13330 [Arthrobacter sp. Sr24]